MKESHKTNTLKVKRADKCGVSNLKKGPKNILLKGGLCLVLGN